MPVLKRTLLLAILALSGALISASHNSNSLSEGKIIEVEHSEEELQLFKMINDYRVANKLSEIPLSTSLTFVAQQHCIDLYENKPDLQDGCNTHSWSTNGAWSSCCYSRDHKQSKCMWDKPSELTNYKGYGFEIAVGSSDSIYDGYVMTAEYAMKSWKESHHHNNVLLNLENWKKIEFKAMGVAIYKGFSTVWFGRETDPEK